jgi:hypothetical protein
MPQALIAANGLLNRDTCGKCGVACRKEEQPDLTTALDCNSGDGKAIAGEAESYSQEQRRLTAGRDRRLFMAALPQDAAVRRPQRGPWFDSTGGRFLNREGMRC